MTKNRDQLHLLHTRDAIEKIMRYTSDIEFDQFENNDQIVDAVLMQFIVIGESVNRLSDEFKNNNPDLPWYQAVALRNQTAHGYFQINPIIVWQTVKVDLPLLIKEINRILDKI